MNEKWSDSPHPLSASAAVTARIVRRTTIPPPRASEKSLAVFSRGMRMTASGFARAMPRVLAHEGGKVNHPKDPGGRTNCGITQRVYDAWRVRNDLAPRDVYAMEARERDAIYRGQYWNTIRGDELP